MTTAQEKALIKEACTTAFKEEMGRVFNVLFGVYVNHPETEVDALNRARKGMLMGLKTLQACEKLANDLP